MKLSVVIPAYNEEGSIADTLTQLYGTLYHRQIDHELWFVTTVQPIARKRFLKELQHTIPTISLLHE